MVDAVQVANYFSKVLRRGRLEEITFQDSSVYVLTGREQLATGALSAGDTATLFSDPDMEKAGRRPQQNVAGSPRPNQAESNGATPISVVVSLVSLNQRTNSGPAAHSGLLLLAANLFPDGRLVPVLETASSPWIPSERLESPSVSGKKVMVGSLGHFWQYARSVLSSDVSQNESFADAMKVADRLFEDVAKQTIEEYVSAQKLRGETVEHELCFVQKTDRIYAVAALLDLYDFLGTAKKMPALVERMTAGWSGERTHQMRVHDGDGLYRAALKSCGSMGDRDPLANSQRRAVHAFLDGAGSEVTAVSGPPGTGKTTMLQAVVANLVTRRALEKGSPPVIVGTSTNNQAVTNIISSFASVAKDEPGALEFRWLPQERNGEASADEALRSLAVYCPSTGKLAEARTKFLVEQKDKGQTYSAYSSQAYIAGAKDRFALSAHAFFGSITDIPQLQQWIHDALTELDGYRVELVTTMRSQGRSNRYISLCEEVEASPHLRTLGRVKELKECDSLELLDQKLDVTLRYAEFWLAVHYFEAQWLLTKDFIDPEERFKQTSGVMERYWRQAAALTPCFVMTVYQVPKYFKLWTKQGEPTRFDTGRIDLLIVDEAGQVDAPLGLPSFALASRALVVGDEKQLPPVWSIDEQTDREVAQSVGISANAWSEDLQKRGVTCSEHSSLMRAATYASSWSYGKGSPGLFLAEHFRCHPDIIGFCNTLLYDGLLKAERSPETSKLHELSPAFLWIDVPSSHDSQQGSSRTNQAEAEAVAVWIVENYARFRDVYSPSEPNANKRVAEDALIAVVTPFSAQARLINQELEKAVKAAEASADLPEQLWTKITVGTADRKSVV